MNEGLKNRLIIVLAILAPVFLLSTLSSCSNSLRQKSARDREMAMRLALEERMSKFSQDKSSLEEKAKAKEKEAQDLKDALEASKKALVQEQMVNQSLKDDLDKLSKLKDTLEQNLKEALAAAKKSRK